MRQICENCVIYFATGGTKFAITDIHLYVPIKTLSTRDKEKLLQQSKSGLKRTTYWNKYQSKVLKEIQNQYLHYFSDPSFQRVSTLFCFII